MKKIALILLIANCQLLFANFSYSQDLFSLMDDFIKKSQNSNELSWMQVSRTYEKGKTDALTSENCYFHKKGNSSFMRCKGEGMELETVSNGSLMLQVDKESKTIALTKINGDSIWANTQNAFLKFKEVAASINERKENKSKVFTLLPKKEFQGMYDSILYRWDENILKKMEIYPAKQFQSLIASNDDYTENPDGSDIQRAATKDIHWEIVYEQLDALPFAAGSVENYIVKKPDGKYELTEKYKSFSLLTSLNR